MFNSLKNNSQKGFVSTYVLIQALVIGVGTILYPQHAPVTGPLNQTAITSNNAIDDGYQSIEEVLNNPQAQTVLQIQEASSSAESTLMITTETTGLEVTYTPEEMDSPSGLIIETLPPEQKPLLTTLQNQLITKKDETTKESSVPTVPTPEVTSTQKPTSKPTVRPTQTAKLAPASTTDTAVAGATTEEPTPKPTTKPSINPTPSPTSTPVPQPGTKPPSLDAELIFQMINNHRAKIGKPAFEKDPKLCEIAESRGPELYDEIFVNRNIHAGFKARNIPYWMTENMVSYGSEQANFNWWMNSRVHRSAIEGDHKYSCGTCWGNSCAQLFTSWVPK